MRSRSPHADPGTVAIAALSHFATDAKVMARFFAITGLDVHTLNEAAHAPGFAEAILDFVLADERLVLAIAEEQELPPEAIVAAREALNRPAVDDNWPPRPSDDL